MRALGAGDPADVAVPWIRAAGFESSFHQGLSDRLGQGIGGPGGADCCRQHRSQSIAPGRLPGAKGQMGGTERPPSGGFRELRGFPVAETGSLGSPKGVTGDLRRDLLLDHAAFVRALARSLLADEHEAEDVAQEALTVAIQRGGDVKAEALGGWLYTVTRHLAFRRLRGQARRRHREKAAARPQSVPGTAELLDREETLREVVDAVRSLPEHYRAVILLRYFEGLPPRKIAQRLELNISTVRMRLYRAQKLLRQKLDAQYGGDRERWQRGLLLLVGPLPSRRGLPVLAGALGLMVALTGIFLVGSRSGNGWGKGPAQFAGPALEQAGAVAALEGAGLLGESGEKSSTEEPPLLSEPTEASPEATEEDWFEIAHVRVVDSDGLPVAGARVLAEWGRLGFCERGRTRTDGRLALRVPRVVADAARRRPPLQLAARLAGYAPSAIGLWAGDPEEEVVLRLRENGARLAGWVVDGDGAPVAGARVTLGQALRLGQGVLGGLTRVSKDNAGPLMPALVRSEKLRGALQNDLAIRGFLGPLILDGQGLICRLPPPPTTRTNRQGYFSFEGVEPVPTELTVEAAGFVRHVADVDPTGVDPLGKIAGDGITGERAKGEVRIELKRAAAVHGRVLRADGMACDRARTFVYALGESPAGVRIDDQGSFAIENLAPGKTLLFAQGPGGSARLELELAAGEDRRWEARLVLGEEFRGTLSGPGGALAGWRVEYRAPWNLARSVTAGQTAADGTFHLSAVPCAGRLYAFPPQGAVPVAERPCEPGGGPLDWRLEEDAVRVGRLSGTVLREDGSPLPPGQHILLYRAGDPEVVVVRLGRGGRFESPPLALGEWSCLVPGENVLAAAGDPAIVAGGDLDLGELWLEQPARLRIVGEPDRTHLILERLVAGNPISVFSGWAELPTHIDLGPGSWRVTLGAGPPREITLHPGESREVH